MNNTITIILNASGSVADVRKDFTLYQGQYQSKLLDVLVPSEMLAPIFVVKNYIGQMNMPEQPTDADLFVFVESMTTPSREPQQGDIVEFYNSTEETYWLYTFNDGEWESTEVNGFGTVNNPNGTSVKIGLRATQRNGILYESKSYFMRYLKTIKIDEVEYALYERQLPKEFTTFAGQGTNAPTLVCNVVNIDDDEVTSLITTQTCALDVMPSTALDKDETIEASDLENLEADINTLAGNMELKQDKEDIRLATQSKTVVGAINGLNDESHVNTQNIANNTQDIVDLSQRVANIEQQQSSGGDTFVGTMTGSTLPTETQLNDFVYTTLGREPKGNDIITFILEVTGGTDKNYQYKYSGATQTWSEWEIPATEPASNENMGIVKGSYDSTLASTRKTQVNIVGGEIEDIYITDNNGTQEELHDYLNGNKSTIDDIISGTQQVGSAVMADEDGLGNNIANTYMTNNNGASKQDLVNYALPRVFNDVSFLQGDNTYGDTIPESVTPIYSATTTSVGDYELFYAEKTIENATFELSNKNSYTNTIFVATDRNCQASLRLILDAYINYEWVVLNVEITEPLNFEGGTIKKVVFGSTMNYLDNVITITDDIPIRATIEVTTTDSTTTDFNVYSNETYPSTMYLNTTSQVIELQQGELGEIVNITIPSGTYSNTHELKFIIPSGVQVADNVMAVLNVTYTGAIDSDATMVLSYNNQDIQIITPYNFGTANQAEVDKFDQICKSTSGSDTTWQFVGLFKISNNTITLNVVGMDASSGGGSVIQTLTTPVYLKDLAEGDYELSGAGYVDFYYKTSALNYVTIYTPAFLHVQKTADPRYQNEITTFYTISPSQNTICTGTLDGSVASFNFTNYSSLEALSSIVKVDNFSLTLTSYLGYSSYKYIYLNASQSLSVTYDLNKSVTLQYTGIGMLRSQSSQVEFTAYDYSGCMHYFKYTASGGTYQKINLVNPSPDNQFYYPTIKPLIKSDKFARFVEVEAPQNLITVEDIWTDGRNIYFSQSNGGGGYTYQFDKKTLNWVLKTESGLTNFDGSKVFHIGKYTLCYKSDDASYWFINANGEWQQVQIAPAFEISGYNVWTDGTYTYYDTSIYHYILTFNGTTLAAQSITWNLPIYGGSNIWSDGENIYYSDGQSAQYVLDPTTLTWSTKTWNGTLPPFGIYADGIWSDGENIYYSLGNTQLILDVSTSTWSTKTWLGLLSSQLTPNATSIWTDGENIWQYDTGGSFLEVTRFTKSSPAKNIT